MKTTTEKNQNLVDANRNPTLSQLKRPQKYKDDASKFAVTVAVPPAEAFKFFRNFSNLPSFMKDLKSIDVITPTRSRWTVEIKTGQTATWEADIVEAREGELIRWKSVDGAPVETAGSIWFRTAPPGRGTVISLTLDYKIPGGKIAEWLTVLMGDHPDELANVNLRRLKAKLETGEVPTIEGQPSGRDSDATPVVAH